MTTLKQLEEATNQWGEISDIAMSAQCNAAETILEQGNTRPEEFSVYPEYESYWIGSIRSLLSDDEHEEETIKYFKSIGIES
jgi:hypothetical protein